MSGVEPLPPLPGKGLYFATHAEFYAWAADQPGRHERVDGWVYGIAPERGAHLRRKLAVVLALRDAIVRAGVACQALPDGATVEVDENTNYEPDALVNCGRPMSDHEIKAPCPVVVVEIPSPSSRSQDNGLKLADYFRVPTIQHYLIVRGDRRMVIHHRREADGRIETRLFSAGPVLLDPPGISVEVDALYLDP